MKSGTTILYKSICTHPEVMEGLQKEIHYFSLYPHKGVDWYSSHFKGSDKLICGDASPTYFDFAYGTTIPELIKSLVPESKPIIIVRDPIARAVSHFYHYKKVVKPNWIDGIELNEFFSQSFENSIRQTTGLEWALNQILWFSCYCRKLLYYINVFERENLLILTNDQLKLQPVETMRRVFSHLDLDYVSSDFFGQFKYSTGSSVMHLEAELYERLADFLYPDFRRFCELAQVNCNNERSDK